MKRARWEIRANMWPWLQSRSSNIFNLTKDWQRRTVWRLGIGGPAGVIGAREKTSSQRPVWGSQILEMEHFHVAISVPVWPTCGDETGGEWCWRVWGRWGPGAGGCGHWESSAHMTCGQITCQARTALRTPGTVSHCEKQGRGNENWLSWTPKFARVNEGVEKPGLEVVCEEKLLKCLEDREVHDRHQWSTVSILVSHLRRTFYFRCSIKRLGCLRNTCCCYFVIFKSYFNMGSLKKFKYRFCGHSY